MLNSFLKTLIGDGSFDIYSGNQYVEDSNKQNTMTSMVLCDIAGISLLVGGIGIMNIMLVTVSERAREIGIRSATGAPRSSIPLQFQVESSVVCGAGGILGILLGVLGSLITGKLILQMILFPNVSLVLGAFLFSVVLGIAFDMYPAAKASCLTPVEALRTDETIMGGPDPPTYIKTMIGSDTNLMWQASRRDGEMNAWNIFCRQILRGDIQKHHRPSEPIPSSRFTR